jgi:outer membrane protein OmpA-like peptidoglycan-associated protein
MSARARSAMVKPTVQGASWAAPLRRQCGRGHHVLAGATCEACAPTLLQRRATHPVTPERIPGIVQQVLRTPGQPLDGATRAFMEPRLQHDFSHVRVHVNPEAAESASAVSALAYTVGHDVVFGAGQYAPHSKAGKHLIAHELTHVAQQARGGVGMDAEFIADIAADRVSEGAPISGQVGGSPGALQRAEKSNAPGITANVAPSPALSNPGEPPVDEFEFDKADIPPQHLDRLTALRTSLINSPNATITLIGHTDTVGTESYNRGLGSRRAAAVRDFLTKGNGVNPSRIKIESRGEAEPAAGEPPAQLDPNKGVRDPKNRRVEIRTEGLPGAASTPTQPTKGWTFDPTDPKKRPPINLNLPPDYVPHPSGPPAGRDQPETSTSSTPPKKDRGPEIEASVVSDPTAKQEPGSSRASRSLETQIEVKLGFDVAGKRLAAEFPLTIHVGPDGFSEIEIEAALKAQLAERILGGVVTEPTVFVSFNPGVNLDKSTATRLIPDFSAKFKTGLSAVLNVPRTIIKVPIEASVFADPLGKPGAEAKITVFTF